MGGVGSLCIPDNAELGETYIHDIKTPLPSETSKSLLLFVNNQIGCFCLYHWQSFMYFCPFVPCMYYLASQDFIYTEDLKSNQWVNDVINMAHDYSHPSQMQYLASFVTWAWPWKSKRNVHKLFRRLFWTYYLYMTASCNARGCLKLDGLENTKQLFLKNQRFSCSSRLDFHLS